MWIVKTVMEEKSFSSLDKAKKYALQFESAKIMDGYGYIRFVVKNGRVCRL